MKIIRSTQFKEDYKLVKKAGKDLSILKRALRALFNNEKPPGEYGSPYRHTDPYWMRQYYTLYMQRDWTLIYKIDEGKKELLLARMELLIK